LAFRRSVHQAYGEANNGPKRKGNRLPHRNVSAYAENFPIFLKIIIKICIFQIETKITATRQNSAKSSSLDEICAICGRKFGKLNMARWIYQRPIECCDSTELIVAKRLALLSDDWVVRWGFYYDSDREGDFLILGPSGGVLHVTDDWRNVINNHFCPFELLNLDFATHMAMLAWRRFDDELNCGAVGCPA
jgi:hypothetical protein